MTVVSKDFGTHLVRLKQVLTCLRDVGFKLKMSKCYWGKSFVAFLGHIVTHGGILPNPEKVKSVLKIEPLRNVGEVRAFLGLAGYFRQFIKGYAAISQPLERLKTAELFQWDGECDVALDKLKRTLASPPILAYPDFELLYIVLGSMGTWGDGWVQWLRRSRGAWVAQPLRQRRMATATI
ncbi:hypothetical protein AaE_014354 [Aphanomyces astaci]|uniref:Reverse transcriptase domain-containing protein n=1 Tax=Aphanomyces astaci TaxID=112090 RepID=A0A6A4Z6C3_APHAT|nr:hypothetical protein AaE_014354 [Aphanomyces astaci]